MASVPLLECRGVTAGYLTADGAARAVVRDVSFVVRPGEHLAIVGESGSGKTTLLRVLNGFAEPLQGEVYLGGEAVTALDPCALRRRVVLVAQTPAMFDGTVFDNVRIAAPDCSRERAAALLEEVTLGRHYLEATASSLSGGEQQRVALARALALDPEVLVLDEPTSALDPGTKERLTLRLLEHCGVRECSIIVATHDDRLADALGATRWQISGEELRRALPAPFVAVDT